MSSLTLPRPSGQRVPYDDPASPHEMFGDCVVAGRTLAAHPAGGPARAASRPAAATQASVIEVPASTARMAGALHLHLT